MPQPLRVLHYVNQFFGGIGGEEHAGHPPEVTDGAVGPGRLLEQQLGGDHKVVATLIIGDNYFQDQNEQAVEAVNRTLQDIKPDVVVAGPAFQSGRYGIACAEVVKIAQESGVPGIAGMNGENPAAPMYSKDIYIAAIGASPASMEPAMETITGLALKLATGQELGPAGDEGYLPRGVRKIGYREEPGYLRAVNMLVRKLRDEPIRSEIPYQPVDRVVPATPIADLSKATIALATTGGLIRKGNPENRPASNSRDFLRVEAEALKELSPADFDAYHGGYYNAIASDNPNYILPLSYVRELEEAGEIGGVFPTVYGLAGVGTPVAECRRIGQEIGQDLAKAGVEGCLLVATWGTCNRCGATIAKEIERAGVPTAVITAIHQLPMTTGALRVVKGARIEHVVGDPALGPEKDHAYGLQIVRGALGALQASVEEPTLFDPGKMVSAV